MAEFKMPSLGADMDSGILYEWFIKPGAVVRRGDVIASVETDKGVIDIECFEEGVVAELLIEPGNRVPVGQTIAHIGTPEALPAQKVPQPSSSTTAASGPTGIHQPTLHASNACSGNPPRARISPAARRLATELGVDLSHVVGTGSDGTIHIDDVRLAAGATPPAHGILPVDNQLERRHVTPVARRMAETWNVDLQQLTGTGPHGAIGRADVEQAVQARTPEAAVTRGEDAVSNPPAPRGSKLEKPDFAASMRRAIALAMAKSNREIPHYYLETRIDVTKPLARLEAENQKRPLAERILPVILLIRATARALIDVPELNGYWRDDHFEPSEAIHIGFAIALRQGGLVTPAIHDADEKSLDELMAVMRDLITRTRGGRLRSSELTDATITLTSLGDTGVEKVFGVIYPPQVALVGFGKITEQPWAENGMLGVRPILTATLAGDHRASDGRRGAQFLGALEKHLLETEAQ